MALIAAAGCGVGGFLVGLGFGWRRGHRVGWMHGGSAAWRRYSAITADERRERAARWTPPS